MRGVDRAGNQESYPTSAETSVSVSTSFCNSSDVFEDDNNIAGATAVSGVVNIQVHNFCNDAPGSNHLNDQDWVRINLTPGSKLIVTAEPLHGATAAVLRLYAADGSTLLAQSAAQQFGDIAQLVWESPGTGVAYLQVTHVDGRIAGNSVQYRLTLRNGHHSFLPQLFR
jgi:hypothetical protein